MSYCTDQLLTPNFSGESTLNGTPGGDRWARVRGGRLSGCRIFFAESTLAALRLGLRKNLKMQTHGKHGKKNRPTQTRHEIYSHPATATNSRRRTAKHVPRVSPHSPASIDPGFVKIGLVQLSHSVKTPNVTHTLKDKFNNGTLYAPRYEETFLTVGKKRPHYEETF